MNPLGINSASETDSSVDNFSIVWGSPLRKPEALGLHGDCLSHPYEYLISFDRFASKILALCPH